VSLADGTQLTCHSGNGHEDAQLTASLARDLGQLLIGRSLHDVERNWQVLLTAAKAVASPLRQRHLMHAIGTLDAALWNALGRVTGQPLCRLLGSDPEPVPAMLIGGYFAGGDPKDDAERAVTAARAADVMAVKLKVGGQSPEADVEKLRWAREFGGADLHIICDVNRAWSLAEARRFIDASQDYRVEWLEEPVTWLSEITDLPILRALGRVPICAGQSEIAPQHAMRLIHTGAVDVINFDATWGGGITGWRKVAGLAELTGVRVAHHAEPHLAMHLLAGRHRPGYVEVYEADRDPVWHHLVSPPAAQDGYISAPDRPGLGLEIDEDFAAKYRV
jgi:D-arabinonate dehydratase